MTAADPLRERLRELREGFDRAFAEPERQQAPPAAAYLAIRVGRAPYAVPLAQVAAVESGRAITRVPSDHAELLGITGLRGSCAAVFDLAALLGVAGPEPPRWLLLVRAAPVAFAFGAFEGQHALGAESLVGAAESGAGPQRALISGAARPVVDVVELARGLERRPRRSLGE